MKEFIPLWCVVGLALAAPLNAPAQTTITNQPQSVTVNYASSASFSVGATNAASAGDALNYQWKFNGKDLLGATGSTLSLEDVQTNQEGSYTVVVNGTVTSSPAVLSLTNGTIVQFVLSGFIGKSATSNVTVALFDHDKPVTVQNFLHYIRSSAFGTNMFMNRMVQGTALQGGVYNATDRTNGASPITGSDIVSQFILASNQNPPFPQELNNEFNNGPLVHNDFGTIAMALASGEPNSANSSFFFNLANNSGSFDGQDFTVFGRIINAPSTNVLGYFAELTTGNGFVTASNFLDDGVLQSNAQFGTLPVNYIGTSIPANSNLVFCDFSFMASLPPETNAPTLAVTSVLTAPLTNNVAGTAGDPVGLADIFALVTPVEAVDGTYPYPATNSATVTNFASGTTNWTLPFFYPGTYNLTIYSQNGAGYLSAPATISVTNTGIIISGNGSVAFTAPNSLTNINPVGYPMQFGSNYTVEAIPGTNETFVNWGGTYYTTNPEAIIDYEGPSFTATFISNVAGGISFASPSANAALSNNLVTFTGSINNTLLSAPVTVTLLVYTNSGASNYAVVFPEVTTATNNWSLQESNYLGTGSYFVQVLATDKNGNSSVITEPFTFTADTTPPMISITSPTNGALLYASNTITATGTANDPYVPLQTVNINLTAISNNGAISDGFFFQTAAVGTSNWTINLASSFYYYGIAPGTYSMVAQAVDAAGNTAQQTNTITLSGILIDGDGTVTLSQGSNTIANPIGYPIESGTQYSLKATPAAGQKFVNWNYSGSIATNPAITFEYQGGLLTATFVPNEVPKGTKGIAFTYPPAYARVPTNRFEIKGTIAPSVKSAQVTCQIFSLSSTRQFGSLLTTTGTKTWAVAVSNLPPDAYMVQAVATNANGFSTVITEEFAVTAFKAVAGTYNGLFLCDNGPLAATNSGFMTLTVGDTGAFTARLAFPGYGVVPVQSIIYPNGVYAFNLNVPSNYMDVELRLDLTNGTDELTGYVYAQNQSWVSPIKCYRAATRLSADTVPAAGKYTMEIAPITGSATNGYAAFSISDDGTVTMTGALPDNASFSESARVGTNGAWPVCVVPQGYKTNGMLIGWETIDPYSGNYTGQLYWYKRNGAGSFFTNTASANVETVGTNYSTPAAGDYKIIFDSAALSAPLTNSLAVARMGQSFAVPKPAPVDKLSISLAPNGIVAGHFVNPSDNKTLQFKGAFFSQSQGGSGLILDNGATVGYFVLQQE